jgi:transcriptional regulator with XRE-family HTH domain
MALVTGNQLKAARALAGVDQQQLAESAGVNVNTIRNMEARGAEPIASGAMTVRKIEVALEALGIEFLNHARPGVRLKTHEGTQNTDVLQKPTAAAKSQRRRASVKR